MSTGTGLIGHQEDRLRDNLQWWKGDVQWPWKANSSPRTSLQMCATVSYLHAVLMFLESNFFQGSMVVRSCFAAWLGVAPKHVCCEANLKSPPRPSVQDARSGSPVRSLPRSHVCKTVKPYPMTLYTLHMICEAANITVYGFDPRNFIQKPWHHSQNHVGMCCADHFSHANADTVGIS